MFNDVNKIDDSITFIGGILGLIVMIVISIWAFIKVSIPAGLFSLGFCTLIILVAIISCKLDDKNNKEVKNE